MQRKYSTLIHIDSSNTVYSLGFNNRYALPTIVFGRRNLSGRHSPTKKKSFDGEGPAKRSALPLTGAIRTFINASLGSDCRTGLREFEHYESGSESLMAVLRVSKP
jgi:hypothetical protein